MMALQADPNFEVLFLGLFRGGQKTTNAWSISSNRLFGENVFALANSFFKLHWAEPWRRCQDHYIGHGDGLLVGVKPDELRIIVHFDFVFVLILEIFEAVVHPVFE